jgi:DNA-directed RNA polymerase II subunit RPB4
MLLKTTDYLDHFARFKRKENVEAVERLLSAHKELAKFERAQLGMFPSLKLFMFHKEI